jgi:hypothetical protein
MRQQALGRSEVIREVASHFGVSTRRIREEFGEAIGQYISRH